MKEFTAARTDTTPDEIWLLQHEPVYTLGQAGEERHILAADAIPVVTTDRGGQVTYHGPGQLVMYVLLNIRKRKIGVRELVTLLEQTVVGHLADLGIDSCSRRDAPGVYVGGAKIAALGLRVSRGCSYHGLAINVDADLEPFSRINPCGFEHLPVTSLSELGISDSVETTGEKLATEFTKRYLAAGNPPETGRRH